MPHIPDKNIPNFSPLVSLVVSGKHQGLIIEFGYAEMLGIIAMSLIFCNSFFLFYSHDNEYEMTSFLTISYVLESDHKIERYEWPKLYFKNLIAVVNRS